MNRLAAALAAVLITVATIVAATPAGASTCVTFGRYLNLRDGQTPATVSHVLGEAGMVLGRGKWLETKRYRGCGVHRVYVNYKRSRVSAPRRAYFELWGY